MTVSGKDLIGLRVGIKINFFYFHLQMRVNMNDGDDVKRLREESRGERFVTHVDLTEPLIVSIPSMLHVKWNERESVANVFSNISIS